MIHPSVKQYTLMEIPNTPHKIVFIRLHLPEASRSLPTTDGHFVRCSILTKNETRWYSLCLYGNTTWFYLNLTTAAVGKDYYPY